MRGREGRSCLDEGIREKKEKKRKRKKNEP
jgi:hypothetical protein